MNVRGSFEVKMTADPPYEVVDAVSLGRATFDKRFRGDLDAHGAVQMLAARTPIQGSAAYVAIERVSGSLLGKRGTFVLLHTGIMDRGKSSLVVTVAPDSGTGELKGLSGEMDIQIAEGQHLYSFDFEFSD